MNNSYRVKANPNGSETVLHVKLDQQYDFLNILSVSIDMDNSQENSYPKSTSSYGVIVGRVNANNGYGVPNVKISVFIPKSDEENDILGNMYPYSVITDKDNQKHRYNLLPKTRKNACHQPVGSVYDKRTILDNNYTIEVFDKYYKYTTSTNQSGDYMLYGVPTGQQDVHMDVDLSDIGSLSQSPRDMIYQGYSPNLFENYNKFKGGDDIDSLPQIISQNTSVYVYPFTGDESDETIAITRHDFNINYTFQPTCVFLGSVVGDGGEASISKDCYIEDSLGEMKYMTTGSGTIEMIRKKLDGTVEQFDIKNGNIIDEDGTWLYQIPMNLDYMVTDELGNLILSEDDTKGIPTKAKVRFRISMDSTNLQSGQERGSYLIPNIPDEGVAVDYNFGSQTKDNSFVTLFTNNVYTVKNYIPRYEHGSGLISENSEFTGVKKITERGDKTPFPYNNIYIHNPFSLMSQCLILKTIMKLTAGINKTISVISDFLNTKFVDEFEMKIPCIYLTFKHGDKTFAFMPGCKPMTTAYDEGVKSYIEAGYDDFITEVKTEFENYEDEERVNGNIKYDGVLVSLIPTVTKSYRKCLDNIIENSSNESDNHKIALYAAEYYDKFLGYYIHDIEESYYLSALNNEIAKNSKLIDYDFYNDWVNGTLYFPSFRHDSGRNEFCGNDGSNKGSGKLVQKCALYYKPNVEGSDTYNMVDTSETHDCRVLKKINPYYDVQDILNDDSLPRRNETVVKDAILANTVANNKYATGPNATLIDLELKESEERWFPNQNCEQQHNTISLIGKDCELIHQHGGTYYYKPVFDGNQGNLINQYNFASGIVLLGNIDEYNSQAIFKIDQYPSTTYNLPSASSEETRDGNDLISDCDRTFYLHYVRTYASKDYQITRQTVIGSFIGNWHYSNAYKAYLDSLQKYLYCENKDNNNNEKESSQIPGQFWTGIKDNKGYFAHLECGNIITKYKTCINLKRISELGVDFSSNSKGLIMPNNIKDQELRAKFTMLNYNDLKTEIQDGFEWYKIDYLYPEFFDGSLNISKQNPDVNYDSKEDITSDRAPSDSLVTYSDPNLNGSKTEFTPQNGVPEWNNKFWKRFFKITGNSNARAFYDMSWTPYALSYNADGDKNDQPDESYYRFRMGKGNVFYLTDKETKSFPRYHNSFYFYFGLKPGATAIDKFNQQYMVKCDEGRTIDELEASIIETSAHEITSTEKTGSAMFNVKQGVYPYSVLVEDVKGVIVARGKFDKRTFLVNNLEDGVYKVTITDIYGSKSVLVCEIPNTNELDFTCNFDIYTKNGKKVKKLAGQKLYRLNIVPNKKSLSDYNVKIDYPYIYTNADNVIRVYESKSIIPVSITITSKTNPLISRTKVLPTRYGDFMNVAINGLELDYLVNNGLASVNEDDKNQYTLSNNLYNVNYDNFNINQATDGLKCLISSSAKIQIKLTGHSIHYDGSIGGYRTNTSTISQTVTGDTLTLRGKEYISYSNSKPITGSGNGYTIEITSDSTSLSPITIHNIQLNDLVFDACGNKKSITDEMTSYVFTFKGPSKTYNIIIVDKNGEEYEFSDSHTFSDDYDVNTSEATKVVTINSDNYYVDFIKTSDFQNAQLFFDISIKTDRKITTPSIKKVIAQTYIDGVLETVENILS